LDKNHRLDFGTGQYQNLAPESMFPLYHYCNYRQGVLNIGTKRVVCVNAYNMF